MGGALTGHTGSVFAVAFSPDGTKLTSADGDGSVWLWDVAGGGSAGASLTGDTFGFWTVAFSSDGTRPLAAGKDSVVWVWDRLWDADEACRLAAPYVTRSQVQSYLPSGSEPKCGYPA